MKRFDLFIVAASMAVPAQAQLLTPNSVGGAVVGGLIGGIVGHNHHRQTAEGAAIGAGAGLLLGALADHNRREYMAPPPAYVPATTYHYSPAPPRAVSGAVLGGIAGGIIGHNHHRQTAEGIAIGAASGLVLGAVADAAAARRVETFHSVPVSTTVVTAAPAVPTSSAPASPAARPATSVRAPQVLVSKPASQMAGANSLFGR